MYIRLFCCFLLVSIARPSLSAQSSEFYDYIEKYKKIAIEEMQRAGVPASIKLSQALLESNAGRSELARRANNHFGIKCHSDWTGKTFEKEDDDFDEFGKLKKSCFRAYRKDDESFIAHSEFLRDPKKANRYGFLFRLDPLDYKRWAAGLKRAGYATAAGYDAKLIRIIEQYELYKYDQMAMDDFPQDRPTRSEDLIAGLDLRKINDVRVIFAKNNVTVQEISSRARVSEKALRRYNEQLPEVSTPLPDDYRVFLQPKRCRFRGKNKWHYMKDNQSMFDISQEYGVALDALYSRNRMAKGTEPQENQRIKLKGCKIKKGEKPRLDSEPKPTTVTVPLEPQDGFLDEEITPENPNPTPRPTQPPTTNPQPERPTTNPTTNPNPPQPSGAVFYAVVKGDTLYSISRRYGLTVDQLMRMNNLSSTNISVGQVLQVK